MHPRILTRCAAVTLGVGIVLAPAQNAFAAVDGGTGARAAAPASADRAAFVPLSLTGPSTFAPYQKLSVTGRATPNATVHVVVSGPDTFADVLSARADGAGGFTVDTSKRVGKKALTVEVTQQSGHAEDATDRAERVLTPLVSAFRPVALTGAATFAPNEKLTITGTATPNELLNVLVSGELQLPMDVLAHTDGAGNFSVQTPKALGAKPVTVRIDQGSGPDSTERTYTPQLAAFVPVTIGGDETFVPHQSLTVSGKATPGATVDVVVSASDLIPEYLTVRADGAGAFTAMTEKRVGKKAVTLAVTQHSGHAEDATDRAERVLTPVVSAFRPVALTGAATFTPNQKLTITGTATPNESLIVLVTGEHLVPMDFLAHTDGAGNFSVQTPKPLGAKPVTVRVDQGSGPDSAERTYSPKAADFVSTSLDSTMFRAGQVATVSGKATPGATVMVWAAEDWWLMPTVTLTADANGTWTTRTRSTLPDSPVQIITRQTHDTKVENTRHTLTPQR